MKCYIKILFVVTALLGYRNICSASLGFEDNVEKIYQHKCITKLKPKKSVAANSVVVGKNNEPAYIFNIPLEVMRNNILSCVDLTTLSRVGRTCEVWYVISNMYLKPEDLNTDTISKEWWENWIKDNKPNRKSEWQNHPLKQNCSVVYNYLNDSWVNKYFAVHDPFFALKINAKDEEKREVCQKLISYDGFNPSYSQPYYAEEENVQKNYTLLIKMLSLIALSPIHTHATYISYFEQLIANGCQPAIEELMHALNLSLDRKMDPGIQSLFKLIMSQSSNYLQESCKKKFANKKDYMVKYCLYHIDVWQKLMELQCNDTFVINDAIISSTPIVSNIVAALFSPYCDFKREKSTREPKSWGRAIKNLLQHGPSILPCDYCEYCAHPFPSCDLQGSQKLLEIFGQRNAFAFHQDAILKQLENYKGILQFHTETVDTRTFCGQCETRQIKERKRMNDWNTLISVINAYLK